jgi:hypothetical protein
MMVARPFERPKSLTVRILPSYQFAAPASTDRLSHRSGTEPSAIPARDTPLGCHCIGWFGIMAAWLETTMIHRSCLLRAKRATTGSSVIGHPLECKPTGPEAGHTSSWSWSWSAENAVGTAQSRNDKRNSYSI